jgi:deoxyribonuclease V
MELSGRNLRIARLLEVQRKLAFRVDREDSYATEHVAGVDQAFVNDRIISGAVVLGPSKEVAGRACCIMKAAFPYIPGLLSFREGPAAIRAVKKLTPRPTLLFVDGCGINHPRMAGLASFVGIMLDMPTIGIAKNVLCGSGKLPEKAGMATALWHDGQQVGHLLKSKDGCRPIVIAPGHRVSMRSSLDLTCRYLVHGKLPEPCRLAHQYANKVRSEQDKSKLDKSELVKNKKSPG